MSRGYNPRATPNGEGGKSTWLREKPGAQKLRRSHRETLGSVTRMVQVPNNHIPPQKICTTIIIATQIPSMQLLGTWTLDPKSPHISIYIYISLSLSLSLKGPNYWMILLGTWALRVMRPPRKQSFAPALADLPPADLLMLKEYLLVLRREYGNIL